MGGFSARNVCFTINNPTVQLELTDEKIRYCIYQKERGENGTEHYQGYIEFTNSLSMKAIKLILGDKAHIEARKGTREQARAYCCKDDTRIDGPFEVGIWTKGQGHRTDLDDVADMVKNKMTIKEVAEEFPVQFIKFNRGIERLNNVINLVPRDVENPPIVEWIYGPTGVGKTRYATNHYGTDYYIKDHTQWWDGYTQQKVIIIDDFDGHWPFRDLLRLLDRYPFQGQTKGGYIHINSPHIIITCDKTPREVYEGKPEHEISQLNRRINSLIYIGLRSYGYEVAGNTKPPLNNIDDF